MIAPLALVSAVGFSILAGVAMVLAPYEWGLLLAFICLVCATLLHASRDHQIMEEMADLVESNLSSDHS